MLPGTDHGTTWAALCVAQQIPSLWFSGLLAFSPTLLALTYPQYAGIPHHCELLSWFREGNPALSSTTPPLPNPQDTTQPLQCVPKGAHTQYVS